MYEIRDSYGCPQCGYDVITCETWEDVEAYFEDAGAAERLADCYATIVEL